MNKNKITGVWQTTKGKVKTGVGQALGNIKMEAEGMGDQIRGKINKNIGKAKAAIKERVDTAQGKKSHKVKSAPNLS